MSHEVPHNLTSPSQPEQQTNPPDSPPAAQAGAPSSATLPKAYDPSIIEQRWADYWVREKIFDVPTPDPADPAAGQRKTFTLLLPPPNVTGRLHMGHMLNQTEIDILMRWHRMCGDQTLWVPGTDHAGIATQMMVERQLAAEGTGRKALGREAFTERVWTWKRQYGSAITDQMRRLGASVDWSREFFTMDDRLNTAVTEAFVRLWEQGLIYRGAYIVNWDPILQSAVSDLEVESEERIGKLYHIRYPFAGVMGPFDETNSIVVATTRPETMLGDVAVAVNPKDARYKQLIGKLVSLPLSAIVGSLAREIPILADDWANPEFGTGAVKVTPAHDPNDFAIGQRHSLPSLSILDKTAHIDLPGSPFHGKDRYEARDLIVAQLDSLGLLVQVKDHPMTVPVSQRSGAVIEPRLSDQWFLAVNKPVSSSKPSIAQTAIDAVKAGHVKFTPAMYEKTYMEWMTNIHDWCISRQLWWGHRIPAWYCDSCKQVIVAGTAPTACANCSCQKFTQETDVLDTWFSSGLLPFTVFGWPSSSSASNLEPRTSNLTPDLAAFYPTSLLITGFDILFFWVARMTMLSCHFMLDVPASHAQQATFTEEERREVEVRGGRPLRCAVPFESVYIHSLVRDANREKMSKTKGNVIDPIEIIQRFGTDAVRFTLASMASPGTDIAFSEARTEGNRAFANKIWNAARFLFMNLDRAREAGIPFSLPNTTRVATELGAPSIASVAMGGLSSSARPLSSADPQSPLESRWIITRLSQTSAAVNASLTNYRFDEAANHVYQFFWGDLCDWYLEIVKLRLNFDPPNDLSFRSSEAAKESASATSAALTTLVAVFESALRLLSPFMPFLTEEIWHALYAGNPPAKSIALTCFPQVIEFSISDSAASEMETIKEMVVAIRALRKELNIPERESTPLRVDGLSSIKYLAAQNRDILAKLARVSDVEVVPLGSSSLSGSGLARWPDFEVQVVYERTIDIPAERERLTRDLAKYEKGLSAAERQLGNEAFMAKAPAHIVEGLRKQAAETRTLYDKTKAALESLN
jgi:valyl-tRNA synthetase